MQVDKGNQATSTPTPTPTSTSTPTSTPRAVKQPTINQSTDAVDGEEDAPSAETGALKVSCEELTVFKSVKCGSGLLYTQYVTK